MGLIHVYTGDGKGKTTAALGCALRIIGWGGRVCVIQFIKGYNDIGEIKACEILKSQIEILQFADDATRNITVSDIKSRKAEAQQALQAAKQVILSNNYDLAVLDEINNAIHYKLLDVDEVLNLLAMKPHKLEIILTGRYAHSAIIAAADYVTDMRCIKHPYLNKKLPARKGIEY